MKKILFLCFTALLITPWAKAQFDVENPETYTLAGLEVEGAKFSDPQNIIAVSGLVVGEPITVPGIQVSDAIKRLWGEDIFSDIAVQADKIQGNTIFLVIEVKERPRIAQFTFEGISKTQADDLREKINFIRGTILTESKRISAKRIIRNFYVEKGFYNVAVNIEEQPDKVLRNGVAVIINIEKGKRVKIDELRIVGNEAFSDGKVKRKLKKFHEKAWWRVWARSKYVPKTFEEAKAALSQAYDDEGYRDATIESDTVYRFDEKSVIVEMRLEEGDRYFHGNIVWTGNYKYDAEILQSVLGIEQGDVYNRSALDQRLFGDPNGSDVSSLYLDNGYLFFDVQPTEVAVRGDTIDLEMRIREGPQASIRKVIVEGNTKTSDQVVRREVRTTPGEKFSRAEIIRSQREILNLGYFDQETLGVQPIPNQTTGTVDIKYTVEERPADQLQLQGGWGGQIRDPNTGQVIAGGFVGTVQLAFNNFSTRRVFDADAWRPVPSGDGQKVSLAFQMNGTGYKNFSATFQEPWLGGKKPISLGVSSSYLVFQSFGGTNDFSSNSILQTSIDLGSRLRWPDDFFISRTSLGYKFYNIVNPASRFSGFQGEDSAFINVITLSQTFARSSVDAPIFPRSGSTISLSIEATPPYSLFSNRTREDYSELLDAEKFRFLEYHKWRFNTQWFFRVVDNLVLAPKIELGYLGAYNSALGVSPFERFFLGGSGLVGGGFAGLDGREILPLRGYDNNSLWGFDQSSGENVGYPIYNRLVMELRYPISLNQSAPIWVLGFLEGGNGYQSLREYNPLKLRRAAGAGVRVMLPMVGLLGLDWAYGFDSATDRPDASPLSGSQFHFILGQDF
ncbi:MAG: outer membrane protein assembly factor BamA [Bacteroidota bacterium]